MVPDVVPQLGWLLRQVPGHPAVAAVAVVLQQPLVDATYSIIATDRTTGCVVCAIASCVDDDETADLRESCRVVAGKGVMTAQALQPIKLGECDLDRT